MRRTLISSAILVSMLTIMLAVSGIAHAAETDTPPATGEIIGGEIYVLEIDGAIGPATAEYVRQKFTKARSHNVKLIVLRMDTPGGLDTAMREIIQEILSSRIPVATFVAPQGARAASAGTYILYASHIAAMAPGTNLGAATPVQLQGPPTELPGREPGAVGDTENNDGAEGDASEQPDPTDKDAMTAKAINDAAAYIESLATLRGRNAEWAISAVREAASLPAERAVEMNVVDLMADDLAALIEALDGREVDMGDHTITLTLKGLPLVAQKPSWRTQLLEVITDPNIALLLMMIGVYGLILEFYEPGAIFPGLVGAVCLLLGLYSLNVLPVNYAGLALMMLGMALIVAEAFVASFGILGLGGGAAFLLGAMLLFDMDAPGFELSIPLLVATTVIGGGLMILLMSMAVRAYRRPVTVGEEQAVGAKVTILDWADGKGAVDYHGERWRAKGEAPFAPGDEVSVTGREGLTLIVSEDTSKEGD